MYVLHNVNMWHTLGLPYLTTKPYLLQMARKSNFTSDMNLEQNLLHIYSHVNPIFRPVNLKLCLCMFLFVAISPPTNLTAEQIGPERVVVSWTPPSPPPSRGYRITVNSTTSSTSVDINAIITYYFLTLQPGVYGIQMVATSHHHYPSEAVGPVEVTVRGTCITDIDHDSFKCM